MGAELDLDRIRYIVRAPIDALGQIVMQSWSWTGDFGVPGDQFGGRGQARYKRAVVVNSGSNR